MEQNKTKVLVVNDDPGGRYLWIKQLADAGYEVVEAMHAEQALGTAATTSPAVAVLDVMLPGMDGFELSRRLKGDPKTAAIRIFHTSVREDIARLREQSKAAGGEAFLPQPFAKNLAAALTAALAEAR